MGKERLTGQYRVGVFIGRRPPQRIGNQFDEQLKPELDHGVCRPRARIGNQGDLMSVSEQLREEAKEITILKSILALMKNTGWDVEKTMDAIGLAEDKRDLYRRSVQHYLEHPENWPDGGVDTGG